MCNCSVFFFADLFWTMNLFLFTQPSVSRKWNKMEPLYIRCCGERKGLKIWQQPWQPYEKKKKEHTEHPSIHFNSAQLVTQSFNLQLQHEPAALPCLRPKLVHPKQCGRGGSRWNGDIQRQPWHLRPLWVLLPLSVCQQRTWRPAGSGHWRTPHMETQLHWLSGRYLCGLAFSYKWAAMS